MGNLPAAHSLTANEQGEVVWPTERTRPDTPGLLFRPRELGNLYPSRGRRLPAPRDVALQGAPAPESHPPPPGLTGGAPLDGTSKGCPGSTHPSWESWGQAREGTAPAARPGGICDHANPTSTDLPPSTSAAPSQKATSPRSGIPHPTLLPCAFFVAAWPPQLERKP